MTAAEGKRLDMPQETFQPILSGPVELERLMDSDFLLRIHTLDGVRQMKICYGDIVKIVNALRDYARLLELACVQWNLDGYHLASYRCHAEKLCQIAGKFQAGIGYDYDAALERCQRSRNHSKWDEGIGEEAMALAVHSAAEQDAKKVAAMEKGIRK